MFIQPDISAATYQIRRFEPGKVWINEDCYQQSFIIRPHQLTLWEPTQLSELTSTHFDLFFTGPPEILLLGTGLHLIIPPEPLLNPLLEKGIGVEFMDSKTACYTYTVLASELRKVAACILIN